MADYCEWDDSSNRWRFKTTMSDNDDRGEGQRHETMMCGAQGDGDYDNGYWYQAAMHYDDGAPDEGLRDQKMVLDDVDDGNDGVDDVGDDVDDVNSKAD